MVPATEDTGAGTVPFSALESPVAKVLREGGGASDAVVEQAHPGDVVLTLGAGTVSQLGPQILAKLGAREQAAGA